MSTTIPDSHRDLLNAPFATLATVGADGRPQLSEVWFFAEGDEMKVSLNVARAQVRNLRSNPGVSLFILDTANPLRYIEFRGDALLTPDDGYAFAQKIDAKYGSNLREMDGPGGQRVVVTVQPTRVRAVAIG